MLVLFAACSGGSDGVSGNVLPDNRVTRITIEPNSASLEVGDELLVRATAFNAAGATVGGVLFNWTSSASAVASVSSLGEVTGIAAGTATITAALAGLSASTTITVTDGVVANVVVSPSTGTLQVAATLSLGAEARNASGQPLSGKTFVWTSATPSIATVNAAGVVTGVAAGTAAISASTAGKSATATINVVTAGPDTLIANIAVTPPSATLQVGVTASLGAVATNAAGQTLAGKSFTWTSANAAVAAVSAAGVVTAVAIGGPVSITATSQGKSASAAITVAPLPTSTGTITVNGAQQFQTMTGWEALMEIGQAECDPRAYQSYKNEVLDRAANELGINRIRVGLRTGFENPHDYFLDFKAGLLTFPQWNVTWFRAVNDNNDPFVMDPAGFHWGYLDYTIEELIIPLKQRLAARGESFWFNISYTGARSAPFHQTNPEEYAEFVVAAFQHIQQKYGFVPNSFELVNEPNLGQWTPQQVAQNFLAAQRRLAAAGFFPEFVGPTASGVVATTQYFDAMIKIPGVTQYLDEISFHRFGETLPIYLQDIARRAAQYGMRTAMLEHGGSGYEHLHEDLIFGNVSAWQQFGLAFCGYIDSGGVYFLISGAKIGENAPVVNTGWMTKFLRQYFRYVQLRAVRIGASTSNTAFDPVAFRNPSGKYTVVVKATSGGSFTVGGLPAGTYGIDYTTTADYMRPLPDVTITGSQAITTNIPASGVLTIFAK